MNSNGPSLILITLASLCLLAVSTANGDEQMVAVGNFSGANIEDTLPPGWEPITFKKIERRTRYRLVIENKTVVIKAESDASASGLIRKIQIDPQKYSMLSWKWKVSNILTKGNA